MKKQDFLKMMVQDNETEKPGQKELYADVIECMDIALSQMPDDFEVDNNKNVKDAYAEIEKFARANSRKAVGPFESAEIIAKYLGATYIRATKKYSSMPTAKVSLEDFL